MKSRSKTCKIFPFRMGSFGYESEQLKSRAGWTGHEETHIFKNYSSIQKSVPTSKKQNPNKLIITNCQDKQIQK